MHPISASAANFVYTPGLIQGSMFGQRQNLKSRTGADHGRRLLRHGADAAAKVAGTEIPSISAFSEEQSPEVRDRVFEDFNSLAVVYRMPASSFIKVLMPAASPRRCTSLLKSAPHTVAGVSARFALVTLHEHSNMLLALAKVACDQHTPCAWAHEATIHRQVRRYQASSASTFPSC